MPKEVTQEAELRRMVVGGQPGKVICEILSQKYKNTQHTGSDGRVLEALNSNPTTIKKKKSDSKSHYQG
jgi:hypothetical protein